MMSIRPTAIALVVSVALNLFLVSAGLVAVTRGIHLARQATIQRPILRRAAASLEPSHRGDLLRLLRAEGRSVQGSNRQARGLRALAWGSLATPSFDAASTKAELAEARSLNQSSRGKVEDAMVDFAATLPASERARLGAALRRAVVAQGPPTGPNRPPGGRHP